MSELKEGETRKGMDEYGNEFIEERTGRVIERRYLGNKVKGKPIAETYQVGKSPDKVEVYVNKTNKGFMAVVNVVIGKNEKGGNWFLEKDFARNVKAQNKLENELRRYFKDVLVEAECSGIIESIKSKVMDLNSKGEPYPSGTDLPKKIDPSEYVMIGDIYGEPIRKKWSEFEKEIYEHKGYEVLKREV